MRISLTTLAPRRRTRITWGLFPSVALAASFLAWACPAEVAVHTGPTAAAAPALAAGTPALSSEEVEAKWGIKPLGPFLSGGGNLIDFRYKVLDPVKAAPLAKRENKPILLNPANGAKLIVPDTPKLGPLRQMSSRLTEGKVYFMLFANTRHHVKAGDRVTITVGPCKLENLAVE